MAKVAVNSSVHKSKGLVFLEYVLLAVCLCVIALRTTFTEGLNVQLANQPINFSNSVYSLSISAVLIFSFVGWFVWSFCSKRFLYRFGGIEIGLCVFTIAAIVAGFAAANKRAAITDFAVFVAPLFMAVLLVQILDSQSKIKLLLAVIVSFGVVSAYQCAEQFFVSNQMMIEQYKQAPESILKPLGIKAGTLNHMLLEHRLYSKDVRGFFTTSNSAGSFALLASFAGVALFIEKFKSRKSDTSGPWRLVSCGTAVAAVILGLAITRSKGAIGASLIAAAMFIIYLLFGNRLKTHKKVIFILCLLVIITGGCGVVFYGLTHGRLPGGNSMLVRWQYWCSTVKMYAEHWLTGVGPSNFVHFYPHYKPAEALETVAEPHNFPLSILAQYGPLGLIGFLALVSVPLWRITSPKPALLSRKAGQPKPAFKKLAVVFVIVVSAALLLVRPILIPITSTNTLDVMIYVIFILYIMPVIAFIVGFLLLTTGGKTSKTTNTNIITAALFCAVLGVLIHNLIDFAIFEPGVFTTFWAIIAALIALDYHQKSRPWSVIKPAPAARVMVVAASLIIIWAYFNYALIPVAKASVKIRQAQQASSNGKFEQTHNLLNTAAEDDYLSSAALSLNGRAYLQRFLTYDSKQEGLLLQAEKCFVGAIERNRADFKNFERLTKVYSLLAEISTQQAKTDWLNKAFRSSLLAIERYPGCGRLRVQLAEIAEQLGKTEYAGEQYKKAIDIEDSYRRQFQLMYPGEKMFSRLGEEKYKNAKQRIKQLGEQPTP